MQLHDLPWPTKILSDLGETEVTLRVTLSYFIEPNPGDRGASGKYAYLSDSWTGTGSALAERGQLTVYPTMVGGANDRR